MKHTAPPLKTVEQVRAEFERMGLSIAGWARAHRVSRSLVYEILSDRPRACLRGNSHRVAVLLGLKSGELAADASAVNSPRYQVARRASMPSSAPAKHARKPKEAA